MPNRAILASLWGIDELLPGNEDKVLACMPILHFSDGRFAAVRELDWNLEGKGLRFTSSDELRENCTILESNETIYVQANELAIIIGPLFYENIRQFMAKESFSLGNKQTKTNDGFIVAVSDIPTYERFKRDLLVTAKSAFDREIEGTLANFLTKKACKALELLIGNPATPPEDYYTRVLSAAKIDYDSDKYRNYHELSSLDLDKPKNVIENWVLTYLSDRIRKGKSSLQAKPESAQPQVLPHEQQSLSLKKYDDNRLKRKEGIEHSYTLINIIWTNRREQLNGSFKKWWQDIISGLVSDNDNYRRIAAAHLLKARTVTLAENVWSQKSSDVFKPLTDFLSIQQTVMNVDHYAKELKLGSLLFGLSQFPEGRILAELCKYFFDKLNYGIKVQTNELQYGVRFTRNNTEADLVLINELALAKHEREGSLPIFQHSGYFVFVSKRQIEKLLNNTIYTTVKEICNKILEQGESKDDCDKMELAARCWISIESGLKTYSFKEYQDLIDSIADNARNIGAIQYMSRPSKEVRFDDDFESFISGDKDIFLGGSNHARLLTNWWNHGIEEYFVVLSPSHFKLLTPANSWPPSNRLVLGRRITSKRSSDAQHLKKNLNELFSQLALLIDKIAKESKDNDQSPSRKFVLYLMSLLSENQSHTMNFKDPWRWSFVADEDSMHQLLLEDNDFNISK